MRAKTGSLSSAASLGGYVTTAAGEKLAFSIMVNNYPRDVDPRSSCIDPIAILLASFARQSHESTQMQPQFTKFHGLGNDYLVIEAEQLSDVKDLGEFARRICNRHYGAGGDGIAIIAQISD